MLSFFQWFRFLCPLIVLGIVLTSRAATSADTIGTFDAANRLYEEGKFADAVAVYGKLLDSGVATPALYFNLGNSFFKSGQIGRAIAAYRQAERLTPRDPDVLGNLQFARNQVQGPTVRPTRWQKGMAKLSLNEWTTVTAAGVWLSFLLLLVMELRPTWKPSLRGVTAASIGAALVLGVCLVGAYQYYRASDMVIVSQPDTVVHEGPLDASRNAFTAQDGAELRVLDQKNDWFQVTDDNRRIGWVKRDLVILPGRS